MESMNLAFTLGILYLIAGAITAQIFKQEVHKDKDPVGVRILTVFWPLLLFAYLVGVVLGWLSKREG